MTHMVCICFHVHSLFIICFKCIHYIYIHSIYIFNYVHVYKYIAYIYAIPIGFATNYHRQVAGATVLAMVFDERTSGFNGGQFFCRMSNLWNDHGNKTKSIRHT